MDEPYNSGLRVSASYGLGCRLWGSGLGSSTCLGAESGFGSVRMSGGCNTVSRIQNGSSWRVGFATHCLGPESRVQNGGSLLRNTSTIQHGGLRGGFDAPGCEPERVRPKICRLLSFLHMSHSLNS